MNLPKDEKSKWRQNSDYDAREDHWIGMNRHLPSPPGEKPLQPKDVRSGVKSQAKSGDNLPANDESVCSLHSNSSLTNLMLQSWTFFTTQPSFF